VQIDNLLRLNPQRYLLIVLQHLLLQVQPSWLNLQIDWLLKLEVPGAIGMAPGVAFQLLSLYVVNIGTDSQ
jgi:hypothetical protein